MFNNAKLIYCKNSEGDAVFKREFSAKSGTHASITVSALGVFDIYLNGEKVSGDILAPGWQCYAKRIGAFKYSGLELKEENVLEIYASRGWFSGRINIGYKPGAAPDAPCAVICEVEYTDNRGRAACFGSDSSFLASAYEVVSSDIYDGIVYDARVQRDYVPATVLDYPKDKFFVLDSVRVREFERVDPVKIITTPKGELVLDFGINMVGYPILDISANAGEKISLSFAEILDADGNFYNENYRLAKCVYEYTCKDGAQLFKPFGTFYGYRYVRINEFPHQYRNGEIYSVWVHSDIERVGNIETSNPLLNKLFDNVIRGQRGNYLDLPTDCPQRNERMGWLGDAQAFIKTGLYNYNCLEFFKKWLTDVVLSVNEKGVVPQIAPVPKQYASWNGFEAKAAWSDAITICPWELYLAYGDKSVLELTYPAMVGHVESMKRRLNTEGLWQGDDQFGDWLGLDAPSGSYTGSSNKDIIATAFCAKSTEILIRVCEVLGKDNTQYKELYNRVRAAFIKHFEPVLKTQTELVLAIHFNLAEDRARVCSLLCERIRAAGYQLETGFVGTPYLLHALSKMGEYELAYRLLLREEYPSWLYPVTMGATTIWEHWDGLRPDGKLWSAEMNSYNHYAYGAVADWMYSVMGGIRTDEAYPGYERAIIEPVASKRLASFRASHKTPRGEIISAWAIDGDEVRHEITTPVESTIIIDGQIYNVKGGSYTFTAKV